MSENRFYKIGGPREIGHWSEGIIDLSLLGSITLEHYSEAIAVLWHRESGRPFLTIATYDWRGMNDYKDVPRIQLDERQEVLDAYNSIMGLLQEGEL